MAGSKADVSRVRRLGKARRHLRVRKKVDRHRRPSAPGRQPLDAAHLRAGRRRQPGPDAGLGLDAWTPPCAPAHGDKTAQATEIGKLLAERAKAAGIDKVVFDRGGNRYHGRIAALADAAREAGLDF